MCHISLKGVSSCKPKPDFCCFWVLVFHLRQLSRPVWLENADIKTSLTLSPSLCEAVRCCSRLVLESAGLCKTTLISCTSNTRPGVLMPQCNCIERYGVCVLSFMLLLLRSPSNGFIAGHICAVKESRCLQSLFYCISVLDSLFCSLILALSRDLPGN